MEGRIKLALFIVIYSVSVILSFYLDDLVDAFKVSDDWQGLVIPPSLIVLTLLVFGFLTKSVKQLLVYSAFAGLILVIFIFSQMYFELISDSDWLEISRTRTSLVLYFSGFVVFAFLATLALMSLGMSLSYSYKIIFKSKKNWAIGIAVMFYRQTIILFFVISFAFGVHGQTPTPAPNVGKAYGGEEIKRPLTTAPQFPSPVTFADITAQTGINFKHNASPTALKYLPETMGAGVAMFDYDNDGRMDLFFTNGAQLLDPMPKGKMPDKSDPKFWNRLYHQKADGTFEDVTEKSGLKGDGYSFGVAVGDYDRDGFPDLFVTRYGGATLYRNNHDGTFTDVTKKLGINVDGWATSAGFLDYDKDGRLDLFVARYVDWDFEKGAIFCGDTRPGYRAYCHPDNFKSSTSLLFHQKADGTFENVSEKAGMTQNPGKALGVAFADFDGDGWTDIFVANDNMEQQLFRNKGDGTFENLALPAGVAFDEKGRRFAGMGIDVADYDGDGKPDVVITTLSNETYPLYRNAGDWIFDYVTQSSGIGQITILGTGWGIKFIDADNDGRRDIFVAQGHVLDTIEKTSSFLKYKQAPLLIRNTEKGFQNVSLAAGDVFSRDFSARGMACGDLDNDGFADIIIAQTDGAPVILHNNGTKNHWLGLDLRGGEKTAPNGEGSRVTVIDSNNKKQIFDASNAGSYLSANDSRIVVGLGESAAVKFVEIRWTSGKIQKLENLPVDRYHLIKEK